jgi:glycyl-tRNA synthetase alpha chain
MDGMEVTQYTYFQQVGGFDVQAGPVELTYGLERLAMYLQRRRQRVRPGPGSKGVTYRDVFHRNEVEQSEVQLRARRRQRAVRVFQRSFDECGRLATSSSRCRRIDQCILTSHTFNLLNARGAISVAERQQYIRRIRELACRCAKTWVENEGGAA